MRRHPTPFQIRTLWNAATAVAIGILGGLLGGFVWLISALLGFLQPVVVPLAVAGIIAYLLDPVVRWFQKRGLTRLRAVISTFGSFLAAGAALLAISIPMVGNQINEFRERAHDSTPPGLVADDPEAEPIRRSFDEKIVEALWRERIHRPWTKPFIDWALSAPAVTVVREARIEEFSNGETPGEIEAPRGEALTEALDAAESEDELPDIRLSRTEAWHKVAGFSDELFDWARGGTGKLLGFLGLLLGFIMVPIYLYFFLKDASSIRENWTQYVPLRASHFKNEVVGTLTEINGYLIAFFRGQVLVAFIDGLFIAIGLTIFGLPLSIPIGMMMAIVGIIPFIGNILTLIPACIIAWFHFSDPANQGWLGSSPWAYVGGVAAIFFIAQQINSMFTAPKIVGDSVGLHPMTVIFSMLFWSLILGGFVGALLAVPLTAAIKVLFRRYIWEARIKEGAEGTPPPDEPAPA